MGEIVLKYQPVVEAWEHCNDGEYQYFTTPSQVYDQFGVNPDDEVLMVWKVDKNSDMYVRMTWGDDLKRVFGGGIEE